MTGGAVASFLLSEREGSYEIVAQVNALGGDLEVNLFGGVAHIGAVGLAEPRQSLKNPEDWSATGSVFTFLTHKEDGIAKPMAEELARRLKRKVVVVAGMHWDGLDAAGIETVGMLCRRIGERIIEEVEQA